MRCLKFIYRRCQEQRRKAGLVEERKKKNRALGSMLFSSFPPSECSWDAFILALHNGSSCGVLNDGSRVRDVLVARHWRVSEEGKMPIRGSAKD